VTPCPCPAPQVTLQTLGLEQRCTSCGTHHFVNPTAIGHDPAGWSVNCGSRDEAWVDAISGATTPALHPELMRLRFSSKQVRGAAAARGSSLRSTRDFAVVQTGGSADNVVDGSVSASGFVAGNAELCCRSTPGSILPGWPDGRSRRNVFDAKDGRRLGHLTNR
jgi:hypothetical protein